MATLCDFGTDWRVHADRALRNRESRIDHLLDGTPFHNIVGVGHASGKILSSIFPDNKPVVRLHELFFVEGSDSRRPSSADAAGSVLMRMVARDVSVAEVEKVVVVLASLVFALRSFETRSGSRTWMRLALVRP